MNWVSQMIKGKITKLGNDFFVTHNIFDSYSQIPTKLPIHNLTNKWEFTSDQEIDFRIVLEENNQYYALLLNK